MLETLTTEGVQGALAGAGYLADEDLATALLLALELGRPLLLEGAPGVGKTEVARALAAATARRCLRLQCYEGVDAAQALYEWNHPRQLLAIQSAGRGEPVPDVYGDDFLIPRPLLEAVRDPAGVVLLIDEIDRADDAFEALLLEFLADFQISIPERGTVRAAAAVPVVLTSNRTRELHDALRRRCLFHYIDYPDPVRERAILALKAPGLAEEAAAAVVAAVAAIRAMPLVKRPGIAETIDWARGGSALAARGAPWPAALRRALGLLLKEEEDLDAVGRSGVLESLA
jgi:MoxR-like ATPase